MLHTIKRDREGAIALLVLLIVILGYLVGMCLWLLHEWNIPVKEYRVIDAGGNIVAARVSVLLYKWLFKRDKG
jgi:hypothetical protein